MKHWASLLLLPLLAGLTLATSGCIEFTSLMKLNADGSGAIHLRFLVDDNKLQSNVKTFQARLQKVSEEMQAQGNPAAESFLMKQEDIDMMLAKVRATRMYNKQQLEQVAASMGPGVRLVKSKEIDENGRRGFLAEFSFPDVTLLKLEEAGQTLSSVIAEKQLAAGGNGSSPGGGMMGGLMGGMMGGMANKEPQTADAAPKPGLRFEFSKGEPAVLTVVPLNTGTPATQNPDAPPDMPPEMMPPEDMPPDMMPPDMMPPDMQANMQQQMTDMVAKMVSVVQPIVDGVTIASYLQVNGWIVETNAEHRLQKHPNTLTMLYVDLGRFVGSLNAETLMGMMKAGEQSAAMRLLALPGLKVQDPQKQLTVKFSQQR